MRVTREAAENIVDALEEHWKGDSDCLCHTLKEMPEVQAVIRERRALETLRILACPTIH